MGSVSPPSATDGSLGGDVGDLALLNIKTLGLSVGLQVLEQREDVLSGLLRPPTVVMTEVLAHGLSSRTTGESSEGDDGGVVEDSLHVLDGSEQSHASAGSGSLVGVLEVGSQVIDSALSSCRDKHDGDEE